jgi:hypothetical protein
MQEFVTGYGQSEIQRKQIKIPGFQLRLVEGTRSIHVDLESIFRQHAVNL